MNEILEFMAGLLPLVEEEFDENDPDKIGTKTSKYISEKINTHELHTMQVQNNPDRH
jgi:hypothetical protein